MAERDLRRLVFGEERRTRRKIPKHIKNLVWARYIGANNAVGKCFVCEKPIHITTFEVGHNKAVAKGGLDNPDNLRPICRDCNLAMGTMSIEAFKRKYFSKPTKKKERAKHGKKKYTKRKRPTSLERLTKQLEKDF